MELVLSNVSVRYEEKSVLNNISCTFNPGVYGILGKNGAGKSTLLHAIFHKPDLHWQGRILFNETELNRKWREKNIGFLPQSGDETSQLNVEQTLLLGMHCELNWKITDIQKKRVQDILHELELQLDLNELGLKKMNMLSGGQRQLVYLAQCVIKKPKILLLDEPCTYLDIKNQLLFIDKINSLSNMIIISTMHEINLTLQNIENIIILNEGNISYAGPSNQICNQIIQDTYGVDSLLLEKGEYRDFLFSLKQE